MAAFPMAIDIESSFCMKARASCKNQPEMTPKRRRKPDEINDIMKEMMHCKYLTNYDREKRDRTNDANFISKLMG